LKILVTGGAGFIGSNLCRYLVAKTHEVFNVDKLTYAGNLHSLQDIASHPRYHFHQLDIGDSEAIGHLLRDAHIEAVMHLAAESHVDRSILGPQAFIDTNIVGTFRLLEAVRDFWQELNSEKRNDFRFHHISTDEVFGDLPFDSGIFDEASPYKPSSPYSASKAASDHLVRAWHHTYGLPIVISNCSNNYGPYHFPEKLIPLVILSALEEKPLPIYGEGKNIRDWLHVEDHARALELVVTKGKVGESYAIGANNEQNNLQVVETICALLDEKRPRPNGAPYRDLIQFVEDRLGHDRRYAIDASKIRRELGWQAHLNFTDGLSQTIDWYMNNRAWWQPLREKAKVGCP